MAQYSFSLDRFHISNTRSRHTDTDYVTVGLQIGGQTFPAQTKAMGDLNNGDYNVGLVFEGIEIDDPGTPVIFNYQIVNNGHASQADIDNALTNGAAQLASEGATALGDKLIPGSGSIWGEAASEAVKWLGGVIFADCDGPVAIDQVAVTAEVLDAAIDGANAGGTYSDTRSYPGTDSPTGCGSNSQYAVTWSASRNGVPTRLRRAGTSTDGAVARMPNHLDVFWVGRDGSVWSNWWDANANNGGWNQPFGLAPAGNAEPGTITAVARTPDHLDVFWVARDGSVWSNWWDANFNNGRWNQPFGLAPAGSAVPGAIAAVARTPGHLDVFWVARDGSVSSNWWDANFNNGRWNQPFGLASAGSAEPGTITAVARTPDHLDVFWVGRDGSVWSNWWDASFNNGRWNQPFGLAPAGSAEPGAIATVARTPDHLDVFWVGRDGSIWSNWWDANFNNGRWNQPFGLAPAGSAEPGAIAAVARTPEHLDVFWVGRDGSASSNWWDANFNNGRWNQPFGLAPAGNAEPGTITAVARTPDHLDVFWAARDGSVWSNWWDANFNNGRWNQPFGLAPAGNAALPVARRRRGGGAVSREANHVDIYWVAHDGSVRFNWWDAFANNGRWNQPFTIAPPGSGTAGTASAAVSREANHVDVYWVAPDGSVRFSWWDAFANNGQWNQSVTIAPPGSATQGTALAAVSRQANHVDVYWVALDGSVRFSWWDAFANNGQWNQPFMIAPPGSARAGEPVTAVSREGNHVDVFWVAPDGSVRSNWWDAFANNGQWNQPFTIAPPGSATAGTPLAAVSREVSHLDVYWVAPDGSVRLSWWDAFANNAQWSQPFLIAPAGSAAVSAPVAAVAREANHVDVFWVAPDGSVRSNWWDAFFNNGQWNQPFTMAPPESAKAGTPITAVGRESSHLDVFWIAPDGSVRSNWWDAFANNGRWNQPYVIASP
jgi:hypothetical protein